MVRDRGFAAGHALRRLPSNVPHKPPTHTNQTTTGEVDVVRDRKYKDCVRREARDFYRKNRNKYKSGAAIERKKEEAERERERTRQVEKGSGDEDSGRGDEPADDRERDGEAGEVSEEFDGEEDPDETDDTSEIAAALDSVAGGS